MRVLFSSPRGRRRESTVRRPGHINELYYQQFRYTIGEYFPMVEFYSFDRYGNITPDDPAATTRERTDDALKIFNGTFIKPQKHKSRR